MYDFQKWLCVLDFRNVNAFLKSEQGKGTVTVAIARVLVSALVSDILLFIVLVPLGFWLLEEGTTIWSMIGAVISGSLFPVFVFLLANGTFHLILRLLGGKGKYTDLICLDSFVAAAAGLVSAFFSIINILLLNFAPAVGESVNCLATLLILGPFTVYFLYLAYRIALMVHGLSKRRTMAAVIVNAAIWFLLVVAMEYAEYVGMAAQQGV